MSGGVERDAEFEYPSRARQYLGELASLVSRNDRHQDRLAALDFRVSVSGTRGKSTMARWLHDELVDRDYDTYAKLTGTEPLSIYNGREWVISRSGRTTLYENEREVNRFFPMDGIVVENQGITPYTTRLVNSRYVDPTLVVVTNIREDHLDTLGGSRQRITRGMARSIPEGTHVICGEQGPPLREYFARELRDRDASVTFVDVPAEYGQVPGAELIYCLDETLRVLDGAGLDRNRAEAYLDSLQVEWQELPAGRVFDAAAVNDVQSTEAVRRALVDGPDQVIQPLVYLRRDRPGRTASYLRYLSMLAEEGLIEQARIIDGHARAFEARTSFPVVVHEPSERPTAVLKASLADGWPVILMGNATPEFMQELRDAIDDRTVTAASQGPEPHATAGTSIDSMATGGSQILLLEQEDVRDRFEPAPPDGFCIDLLTAGGADRLVFISLQHSPDEQIESCRSHLDDPASKHLEFIAVGETERSAAAAPDSPAAGPRPGNGPVRTVTDVTDLGRTLMAVLNEDETGGRSTGVCFDSVTQLLEENSLEEAFRVLHVVTQHLSDAGTTAHYHLPTAGYDSQTVGTLEPLFDTIITVNENGERRVHRR